MRGGRSWDDLARICLSQLDGLISGANLGLVFMADPVGEMADDLLRCLRRETGIEAWVGASGRGIFCGGKEIVDEAGLALLVIELPSDGFRVLGQEDRLGAEDRGTALLHLASDARLPSQAAESGPLVVGGRVSSMVDGAQIAGVACAGGVSGLLVAEPAFAVAGVMHGARELGPWRRITSAIGGRILELDGTPAADVIAGDAGEILARIPEQLVRRVMVETRAVPERPDSSAHHAMIDRFDTRSGEVGVRSERLSSWLRVTHRDAASALDEVGDVAAALVASMAHRGPPRAAIYYSSVERGTSLFGPAVNEAALLQSALGPLPLIGLRTSEEVFAGELTCGASVLCLIA